MGIRRQYKRGRDTFETATGSTVNPAATANDEDAWQTGSANITAFAGQTVRIQIEAADASTASLVEAGVDDVKVVQQP